MLIINYNLYIVLKRHVHPIVIQYTDTHRTVIATYIEYTIRIAVADAVYCEHLRAAWRRNRFCFRSLILCYSFTRPTARGGKPGRARALHSLLSSLVYYLRACAPASPVTRQKLERPGC